jgi:hypothetical protein
MSKIRKSVLSLLEKAYINHVSFVCFWQDWGLKSGFMLTQQTLYCLSHTSSPFSSGYFEDGISQTICLGWPRTAILLVSASQVARIPDISHQHLAYKLCLM